MNSSFYHIRPKLDDLLDDKAPYPYTLSALIAFLSKSHCLEILEFVLEARRYRGSFQRVGDYKSRRTLHLQWQRILQMYIVSGAQREINISDGIRDNLVATESKKKSKRIFLRILRFLIQRCRKCAIYYMIRYYYRSCAAASTKNENNPDLSQHPASTTTQNQSRKKNTPTPTSSHSPAAGPPPQNHAPNPPPLQHRHRRQHRQRRQKPHLKRRLHRRQQPKPLNPSLRTI